MKRVLQILFAAFRVGIAIGLLAYLGFSGYIDWGFLTALLASWPLLLLATLLFSIDLVVTSWRLTVLFKPSDWSLSLPNSIRLTWIGSFFNTCLPGAGGGDVVRIYYATGGSQGRNFEVITIMLMDRAVGLFAIVLWPLLFAPLFRQSLVENRFLSYLVGGALILLTLMTVSFLVGTADAVRKSRAIEWILKKMPFGRFAISAYEILYVYRRRMDILLASIGISLIAHTLTIAVMLLIAFMTNPGEFIWSMAILIPFSFLANMLPITPGGLGVGEAAIEKLFNLAGLAGGAEIILGWRLILIAVSLLGLVFYVQGRQRFVHEVPALATKADLRTS